jgi:hypothetical protein
MRQPDRPEPSVSPVLGPMGAESSTPFRTREVADQRPCVGRKLGRGPAERTGRASSWMDDNPAHVFAWPMLTAMTEIPEGSAMRSAPHPTQARPTPAAGRIMGRWRRPTREPRLKAPRPLPWMRHLVRPRWLRVRLYRRYVPCSGGRAPRSDRHASMASEVVRDARMQSIEADLAIARLVDRLIRRPPRRPSHPSASRAAHGRAG